MKKICSLFVALFLFSYSFSQEKTKVKELGLTLYNLNNYGMIFKIGKENKLWRFRALTGGYRSTPNQNSGSSTIKSSSLDINFSAGREHRKDITDKLNFIYGIELTAGFRENKQITLVQQYLTAGGRQRIITSGLTGVLGMNYFINKNLFVGVELLPSVIYTNNTTSPYTSTSFPSTTHHVNFGFGNNSFLLSAGIKF